MLDLCASHRTCRTVGNQNLSDLIKLIDNSHCKAVGKHSNITLTMAGLCSAALAAAEVYLSLECPASASNNLQNIFRQQMNKLSG